MSLLYALLLAVVLPITNYQHFYLAMPQILTKPTITTSPMSTLTPTPTLTATITPAVSPRPSITPTSRLKPKVVLTSAPAPEVSVKDDMMNEINSYRKSQGLSIVTIDSNACNFAVTRVGEIVSNFNHDGFTNRLNSHTLPYPTYTSVTENIAMNSNYRNVVNEWINSSGHAANLRADTTYACIGQSGNYYAYEGWKP